MGNLAKPKNRALFLISVAVTGAFAGAAVWLFFFAMEHGIDYLLIISEFSVVGCFMTKKMLVVCKYRTYKLKRNTFFKK